MNKLIKLGCTATCLLTSLNSIASGVVLLSNLPLVDNIGQVLGSNTWAQAFTTGAEGAIVKTATLNMGTPLAFSSGTATVSIFENGTSAPLNNGSLGSFSDTTPGVISTEGDYSWTSTAGIELAANTQYWLAVEGDGGNNIRWGFRNIVEAAVSSAQPGWDLVEDRSSSSDSGTTWNDLTFNNGQFVFELDGAVIPEPRHTAAFIGVALLFGICFMRRRRVLR